MKKWRRKHLMMYPFALTRFGENLYEWLTAVALGTQQGMSRKWCYWFREHVLLCRRYARVNFPDTRIWLFEPGWSLAPVVLSRMVTHGETLITEAQPKLAGRYIAPALAEVERAAEILCRSAGITVDSGKFLNSLNKNMSPAQILQACRARYLHEDLDGFNTIPEGAVELCFSMGRLEHFTPEELDRLFAEMNRILVPAGIGSHIVDHRDHFWHYDKSIHCFNHLTFSDQEWSALVRGRHLFRNRLLEPDYIRLFQKNGFKVLAAVHKLHRSDAAGVDPRTLWGEYAKLTDLDLEAAVSHFIVQKI